MNHIKQKPMTTTPKKGTRENNRRKKSMITLETKTYNIGYKRILLYR
jgi:hypothetical protein